jgi:hypothetical protein
LILKQSLLLLYFVHNAFSYHVFINV